jgi:hypothetical protein
MTPRLTSVRIHRATVPGLTPNIDATARFVVRRHPSALSHTSRAYSRGDTYTSRLRVGDQTVLALTMRADQYACGSLMD